MSKTVITETQVLVKLLDISVTSNVVFIPRLEGVVNEATGIGLVAVVLFT